MKVAVVDYGMGNLHSVAKALAVAADERLSIEITQNPAVIEQADKVVFPGVGAMRDCMIGLNEKGLDQALNTVYTNGKPILAICIGLQSLMSFSEENDGTQCLNWFNGEVKKFPKNNGLKVPHMGWNQVKQSVPHPLWQDIPDGARFYFVHSYYVALADQSLQCASTEYGHSFVSAIAHKNLCAVQFHPEKSQKNGLLLLRNFLRWDLGL